MLRRLYHRTIDLAAHKNALVALAFVSFLESSIFPIPPDVILIPMVLAARDRAWVIAGVCTVASVLGGMAGYVTGALLFDQVGNPILDFYNYSSEFKVFQEMYNNWGAWAVFIAGITPFPYKVITILSGTTHLDFVVFSISSLLARGLRFFIVAALLWQFGASIKEFVERRLGFLFFFFVILLGCGYLLAKFLF